MQLELFSIHIILIYAAIYKPSRLYNDNKYKTTSVRYVLK